MAGKLHNPDLPAGHVFEPEDGEPFRNDGREIRPASQNPWYVLATTYGEHSGVKRRIDAQLHAKNQRIWNGWACSEMSDADREKLAKQMELPVEEFGPWSTEECALVATAFEKRLGYHAEIPAPGDDIDFSNVYFARTINVVLHEFLFSRDADFSYATFGRDVHFSSSNFAGHVDLDHATFSEVADFSSATFSGMVSFSTAIFGKEANFRSTTFGDWAGFVSANFKGSVSFRSTSFSGWADFPSATFSEEGDFSSATFSRRAHFRSATFSGWADFSSATFSERADFSAATFSDGTDFQNGLFAGATDFRRVWFRGGVPRFHQREMHQDTRFTLDKHLWPVVVAEKPKGKTVPENAEDAKSAYTRLRQIMTDLHNPDEAHFFQRQEFDCKALLASRLDRAAINLYRLVSGYGWSYVRPFIFLIILVLLGWLVMLLPFAWESVRGTGPRTGWDAIGLSLSNTFAFLGASRLYFPAELLAGLPWWAKMLGGLQTLLGIVGLFFFGLGLRNRFRMK